MVWVLNMDVIVFQRTYSSVRAWEHLSRLCLLIFAYVPIAKASLTYTTWRVTGEGTLENCPYQEAWYTGSVIVVIRSPSKMICWKVYFFYYHRTTRSIMYISQLYNTDIKYYYEMSNFQHHSNWTVSFLRYCDLHEGGVYIVILHYNSEAIPSILYRLIEFGVRTWVLIANCITHYAWKCCS